MGDLKAKLEGLLANKGVMTGRQWRAQAAETLQKREEGAFEIEHAIEGRVEGDPEDGFYLAQTICPLDTPHGGLTLADALSALPDHVAASACDDALRAFDPKSAVFVDTETTGLMGGTGTVAFLVGAGFFEGDAFRLDQCFMRDFDDEAPMLEYLGRLFARFDTVVTYNGKSFDVPLLRTRFIQNRMPFPFEQCLHLDLLHAARRFWKKRLVDCSLTSIERNILGLVREGDVPSADIPRMWLAYLRTRDARPLKGVFYHHKMDILSLAVLTARLSHQLADAAAGPLEHGADEISVLRLIYRQKRYEEVAQYARRVVKGAADDAGMRREALEMLGYACKRMQRWEEMERAWADLLAEFPDCLLARHELAKHHENRTRNLPEALRICRETIDLLDRRAALERGDASRGRGDFERRAARLERKLRRGCGNAAESDEFSSL